MFSGDASVLLELSDSVRRMVMSALSNLAKYLGIYKEWKMLMEGYDLKWSSSKAEDFILSRMANSQKEGNVIEWIKEVKLKIPKLSLFMDFILISGLRLREAVNSYNLIIDLTRQGRINEYYNSRNEALEHYKFKELFIRKTKKVFITFIPRNFIDEISSQQNLTEYQINNLIRRDKRMKSRFGDIREYWATFMTKWLTQPEIDFLQGRVSSTVFMRNYFNPALITDLKERVFKAIKKLEALT